MNHSQQSVLHLPGSDCQPRDSGRKLSCPWGNIKRFKRIESSGEAKSFKGETNASLVSDTRTRRCYCKATELHSATFVYNRRSAHRETPVTLAVGLSRARSSACWGHGGLRLLAVLSIVGCPRCCVGISCCFIWTRQINTVTTEAQRKDMIRLTTILNCGKRTSYCQDNSLGSGCPCCQCG